LVPRFLLECPLNVYTENFEDVDFCILVVNVWYGLKPLKVHPFQYPNGASACLKNLK
jgi:hypothetical protein